MIETVPSKKELRKITNRKYRDKLKLPQKEQDAKLKRKNARFKSQEDKENHVKKFRTARRGSEKV